MYNETTRLVRVIEVPLVADENESDAPGEVAEAAPKGATKEPVRGESDDQQTGVTYKLSDTAGNLWIADGVVAMFTDDFGKTHYAQLAKKEIAPGSARSGDAPKVFCFTFDSGDEFECENADDYPTLANGGEDGLAMTGTVPYGAGGGGSGGGVFVVMESSKKLSASFNEIHAALLDGMTVQIQNFNGMDIVPKGIIYSVNEVADGYGAIYYDAFGFVSSGNANPNFYMWETQDPSTPSLTRS